MDKKDKEVMEIECKRQIGIRTGGLKPTWFRQGFEAGWISGLKSRENQACDSDKAEKESYKCPTCGSEQRRFRNRLTEYTRCKGKTSTIRGILCFDMWHEPPCKWKSWRLE